MAFRLLGKRAHAIRFHIQPQPGLDRYQVDAANGNVTIQASSDSAAGRGLYDYLKKGRPGSPGSMVNWDGTRLDVGSRWWDAHLRGESPAKWRHYFNVCTFGYTTAFWNWRDWESELDWMSLHGINFPLAMVGQEAVWQKVWRRHGMTDDQIRSFFSGPAFLPWHRMGNINSHAGPLPQSWIDNQALLQRRILRRMRELGLTPVLPAFSGFLPPTFSKQHPELKTRRSSAWAGFDSTVLLDPRDPLFAKIGKEFIDTYRSMFGVDGYYLADVFNEMTPQVDERTKLEDLRLTAKGVYDAIKAGDPKGVWVTQGWLFFNESSFWHEPEIAAYLSGVPKEKILLLDLFSENTEIWRRSAAFRDRPYIWNMLHNFGGQTPLFGDMQNLVEKVNRIKSDSSRGGFAGMGLTMEGIHQNAPMYELMTDLMWSHVDDTDAWYEAYLANRWGSRRLAHELAGAIKRAFYSGRGGRLMVYQRRPSLAGPDEGSPISEAVAIARKMLSVPEKEATPLFRKDAIDVLKQAAGDAIGVALGNAFEDLSAGRPAPDENAAYGLMAQLDRILDVHPHYRLNAWVERARQTVAVRDRPLLARNARLQVTQWGGPDLSEYAAKEWSGLVGTYYLPRWRLLFDAIRRGEKDDKAFTKRLVAWEDRWILDAAPESLPPAKAWPAEEQALLEQALRVRPSVDPEPGIAVGRPTSDSGGTEPGGEPQNAADGKVGGGWWAASPYPQWWQVDLGAPTLIDRVQVFTYYGDGRYYRYQVESSVDGQSWTTLADMSENTTPSDRRGFDHHFQPTQARFVRVKMLFNSANVGVHLREVKVFAAKER